MTTKTNQNTSPEPNDELSHRPYSSTVRHLNKETSGYKVRKNRIERGWTQFHLARLLGISIPAVSKIEADQTDLTVSRIKQFATVFEVPLITLMPGIHADSNKQSDEEINKLNQLIEEKDLRIVELQRKVIDLYEIVTGH
jgi:transcriptional regulator with XRE-family HTH domain